MIYPDFFGLFVFVLIFENVLTVCFEAFVFSPLAPTVLSNKSWRTPKYFSPVLLFANLSTYAKSIHQISFSITAKALIPLDLGVVCVNLVYEDFECKSSPTFSGDSLAAFAKLRNKP